jgi:hypothetical protein
MPSETIQIGPLLISRVVFDVIATLLSVIVGGFITYLTTSTLESKKWKQEKKDKFQEQRRDAIGLALEWVDPIKIAVMQASALAMLFINNNIDFEELMREWPDSLHNIAHINIPARLRILVPSNIVEHANEINFLLLNQKIVTSQANPSLVKPGEDFADYIRNLQTANDQMQNIKKLVDMIQAELVAEYEKTFK